MRDSNLPSPGKINRSHALRRLAAKAISYGEIVKARSPSSDVMSDLNSFFTACALACGFTPAALFMAGEKGWWYDFSDLSTLFQDSAGTVPVTAAGQPVGRVLDKSGNGNHLTASGTARPTLEQDGAGFWYLQGDGIDGTISTPGNVNTGSATSATVFSGFKRDNTSLGWVAQLGAGPSIEIGSFTHLAYSTGTIESHLYGTQSSNGAYAGIGTALTVATSQYDLTPGTVNADSNKLRTNGVARTLTYGGQVPTGGEFSSSCRAWLMSSANSYPLTGRVYSSIARFAESTTQEIEDTEAWINDHMGAF